MHLPPESGHFSCIKLRVSSAQKHTWLACLESSCLFMSAHPQVEHGIHHGGSGVCQAGESPRGAQTSQRHIKKKFVKAWRHPLCSATCSEAGSTRQGPWLRVQMPAWVRNPPKKNMSIQDRLSDLIGPYWGTYGIVYRVLQPLLDVSQFIPKCPLSTVRQLFLCSSTHSPPLLTQMTQTPPTGGGSKAVEERG